MVKEEIIVNKKSGAVENNEIVNEEVSKKKKSINKTDFFLTIFIKRLKEDKLYLISFIIIIMTVLMFSIYKVSESDGIFNSTNEIVENEIGTR